MKRFSYNGWLVALCLVLGSPIFVQAQTDTTNVWFSNGPTGQLIVEAVAINPTFSDTLFAGSLGGHSIPTLFWLVLARVVFFRL